MASISYGKILKFGAVCFVPASQFDAVSTGATFGGQVIVLLDPSDELPGFWGYFTLAGMPDPSMGATNPGLPGIGDDTDLSP